MSLKVSVRDGKTCEKILKIEVAEELIKKEYDEFYREIAPKAKIPGFRPGKAPRDVLAMHFGQDARQNVLKHLISHSYREAVKENSLEPLGLPEIKDVKFETNKLSYDAYIEIRPKIKISRATGLSAKKESAEVKAREMEDALRRIQESLAQFKVVEDRPAQMKDIVIADYACTAEGKEIEKRADDWFELKEDEFLKGFSSQLVGVKPGEEKEIRINFPEKMAKKELAGKPAVFKMKIKEIKTKVLPEINDEMAKEAGEFKTLAELKEKIQKDLAGRKEQEAEAHYERALLDELVKQNKIELPEGLVSRRLEYLVEDSLERFGPKEAPESKVKELKETLRKELAPEARRQVHLAFLLDEIAAKENITVAAEDLKAKYQRVASEVRQPVEEVEKYYQSHEEAKDSLHDQIRNEKTIEFIKKNARKD